MLCGTDTEPKEAALSVRLCARVQEAADVTKTALWVISVSTCVGDILGIMQDGVWDTAR